MSDAPLRLVLLLLAAALAEPQRGSAQATSVLVCEGDLITVTAASPTLAKKVCTITTRAIADLAICNVTLDRPVSINLLDVRLPTHYLGMYCNGTDSIKLLPPTKLEEQRLASSAFAPIPTPRYFESIIVHELNHAAFDAVPCPFGHCIATAEYLSYVMQLRSLSVQDQIAFLGNTDFDERVSRDRLSAIMVFLDPDGFARKAWLHFNQRPDPCGFAGQIMSGAVLLDRERP